VSGDVVVVERADYLCGAQFVSNYDNKTTQNIALREGMRIVGPFKGMYLSHPPIGGAYQSKLILLCYRNGNEVIEQDRTKSQRVSQPFNITPASNITTYAVPVPEGARLLSASGRVILTSAVQGGARVDVSFTDQAGASILGYSVSKTNPKTGAVTPFIASPPGFHGIATEYTHSGTQRGLAFAFSDIVVPADAFTVLVTVTAPTAPTSNDSIQNDAAFYFA
jgi:hypothetical protein